MGELPPTARCLQRTEYALSNSIYAIVKELTEPFAPLVARATFSGRTVIRAENAAPTTTQRAMVELIGIEPTTSGLQSPRSPN